jgi:hypothetical protein
MVETQRTIKVAGYASIEDALEAYANIKGHGLFECYGNEKASTISVANRGRVSDWLVSVEGDIYFLFEYNGLKLLNKLTLGACLDDSPFKEVDMSIPGTIIVTNKRHPRDTATRRKLVEKGVIVTTL